MKKYILIGVGILGMLSFSASASTTTTHSNSVATVISDNEITAVITKNTSEKELEDLKSFFEENGIKLELKNIKFNTDNEITGIHIIIEQGNNRSQYSSSSTQAIPDIELGVKDGALFVTTKSNSMFAFSKGNMKHIPNIDSLLQKNGFVFEFDHDSFNDQMVNINKIVEEALQSQKGQNFMNHFNSFQNQFSSKNKYHFVDNPDIDKLIIIDGKEADFETLDKLAKADELDVVDFLKPKTAMSVYGKKAKDGAIVATTKK
ncbi:hypothetical protein [Aquimarina rhabdastrellae]